MKPQEDTTFITSSRL